MIADSSPRSPGHRWSRSDYRPDLPFAVHVLPERAKGRADNGLIEVVRPLSVEGLRMIVLDLARNFVEFAPLATVLVALSGAILADLLFGRRMTVPHHPRSAGF